MSSGLSTLNTTTEVPLSKALNPQLLPACSNIGCPLLQVCVFKVCVCPFLIDELELGALLVDYCDVFISCLNSYSDGTIPCRGSTGEVV